MIGLAEVFEFDELLSFPIWTIMNHGSTWNEQSWTIWATVLVFAPLTIVLLRAALRACGLPVLESMPISMRWEPGQRMPTVVWRPENPRVPLYELAVIAFVATIIENFIHLNIAAQGTSASDYGYWVALFAVILLANGVPLWHVLTSWAGTEYRRTEPYRDTCWARLRHNYLVCSGSALWAPWDVFFGLLYFIFFGAGFFVGPAAVVLAGLLRLRDLPKREWPKPPRPRYKVSFTLLPPKGELAADQSDTETASLLIDDVSVRPGLYVKA